MSRSFSRWAKLLTQSLYHHIITKIAHRSKSNVYLNGRVFSLYSEPRWLISVENPVEITWLFFKWEKAYTIQTKYKSCTYTWLQCSSLMTGKLVLLEHLHTNSPWIAAMSNLWWETKYITLLFLVSCLLTICYRFWNMRSTLFSLMIKLSVVPRHQLSYGMKDLLNMWWLLTWFAFSSVVRKYLNT